MEAHVWRHRRRGEGTDGSKAGAQTWRTVNRQRTIHMYLLEWYKQTLFAQLAPWPRRFDLLLQLLDRKKCWYHESISSLSLKTASITIGMYWLLVLVLIMMAAVVCVDLVAAICNNFMISHPKMKTDMHDHETNLLAGFRVFGHATSPNLIIGVNTPYHYILGRSGGFILH